MSSPLIHFSFSFLSSSRSSFLSLLPILTSEQGTERGFEEGMVVFHDVNYDEFLSIIARIDLALMKRRKEEQKNKTSTTSIHSTKTANEESKGDITS